MADVEHVLQDERMSMDADECERGSADYEEDEERIEGSDDESVDGAAAAATATEVAHAEEDTSEAQIKVDSFQELKISDSLVHAAQEAWNIFIQSAASREAACEAIFAAIFDSAPSLQSLFTTPRAIQAMKFGDDLNQLVRGLSDPPALKIMVETLAFRHLSIEVTLPRGVIFRDAILDLFHVELGGKFASDAYNAWYSLLSYVCGAIIYVRRYYADIIQLIGNSWAIVNDEKSTKFETLGSTEARGQAAREGERAAGAAPASSSGAMTQKVPTTFKQMFQFNAAVMGFGLSMWMNEVLACFDKIVTNVSNSQRLVEECDFLVCRISRVATGRVELTEFKSCMLAALRSLLPKDWTTSHEVAWSWLWENVERTLIKNMGMPAVWERAYERLLDNLDEATGFQLRRDIYLKFFALAPAGQDFFKQSNTYLHLVATKVLVMVIDIYRDPVRLADDISGLGLRHVGYGISIEFMPPYVSACVEVVQGLTQDQTCVDGFQWSIGLISKSLVRIILEGSTIVMKSIAANSKRSLKKAVSNAPRGERSTWMLLIQVGTENISPLAWSIASGALESASAMITDLLTIRADRDRYYYAADELFARHPAIVQTLLGDAPGLLPELFIGLVWRSSITVRGMRRVNYYIKHLLSDPEGRPAKTLQWIGKANDPKLVCHPALVLLSDLLWSRVACRDFLLRKSWFVLTLAVFVICQSILQNLHVGEKPKADRHTIFALRFFIYVFSMGSMFASHTSRTVIAYKRGATMKLRGKIPVPLYLNNWQEIAGACLLCVMLLMLSTEPLLYCVRDSERVLFNDRCPASKDVRFLNSVLSASATCLYYMLLLDMAVIDAQLSAYVLVCGRMLAEVGLFLLALVGVTLTFSSGLSCLDQPVKSFHNMHEGSWALFEMSMHIYDAEKYRELRAAPTVLVGSFCFTIIINVFLLNTLVCQLIAAYASVYSDMVGYARLQRVRVVANSMRHVTQNQFEAFVASLNFEKRLDFNEGDVGLSNGIATTEPANANPNAIDRIKRFGGSTSPSIKWPEDDAARDDATDKFERLETLIKKARERITNDSVSVRRQGVRGSLSASSSGMSGGGSSMSWSGAEKDSGPCEGRSGKQAEEE